MLLRPRGMPGVRRGRAGGRPRFRNRNGDDHQATAPTRIRPAPRPPRPRRLRRSRGPAEPPAPPVLEKPPPSAGRMVRLRARLARSQSGFGAALLGLLSRDRLDDETWDEIEEVLITADVGVTPARQIVSDLRTRVKVEGTRTPEEVRAMLRAELLAQVETEASRALRTQRHEGRPAVILVVGVNGTGKTTTCGKLARALVGDGETVVLGAADTFRAAAADQLQTWGDAGRRADRPLGQGAARTRPASPSRRCQPGHRAGGGRGAHRHGGPPAHQDRPDGRARQGQAGHREAHQRGRGAARARRHHRAERAAPGPGVRRGGGRDRASC